MTVGKETVSIGSLFVKFDKRGKGIGKKLMEALERKVSKFPKIKDIVINSAFYKPTIKFYEKFGFKVKKIKMLKPEKKSKLKIKVAVMEKQLKD